MPAEYAIRASNRAAFLEQGSKALFVLTLIFSNGPGSLAIFAAIRRALASNACGVSGVCKGLSEMVPNAGSKRKNLDYRR